MSISYHHSSEKNLESQEAHKPVLDDRIEKKLESNPLFNLFRRENFSPRDVVVKIFDSSGNVINGINYQNLKTLLFDLEIINVRDDSILQNEAQWVAYEVSLIYEKLRDFYGLTLEFLPYQSEENGFESFSKMSANNSLRDCLRVNHKQELNGIMDKDSIVEFLLSSEFDIQSFIGNLVEHPGRIINEIAYSNFQSLVSEFGINVRSENLRCDEADWLALEASKVRHKLLKLQSNNPEKTKVKRQENFTAGIVKDQLKESRRVETSKGVEKKTDSKVNPKPTEDEVKTDNSKKAVPKKEQRNKDNKNIERRKRTVKKRVNSGKIPLNQRRDEQNDQITGVNLSEIIEQYGFDPSESTQAVPGSHEKKLILEARNAAGLNLWHEQDFDYLVDLRALSGFDIISKLNTTNSETEES